MDPLWVGITIGLGWGALIAIVVSVSLALRGEEEDLRCPKHKCPECSPYYEARRADTDGVA